MESYIFLILKITPGKLCPYSEWRRWRSRVWAS